PARRQHRVRDAGRPARRRTAHLSARGHVPDGRPRCTAFLRPAATLDQMRTRAGVAVLVLLGAVVALVPAHAAACPVAACVTITDSGYDPTTVTVNAGEQVQWENKGTKDHSVIAEDGSFSQDLSPQSLFTN